MKRVAAQVSTKARIGLRGAPCCRRILWLNHAAVDGPEGPEPDPQAIATAQMLHVRQCTG